MLTKIVKTQKRKKERKKRNTRGGTEQKDKLCLGPDDFEVSMCYPN
jgi:hypothetical protein